MSLYLGLRGSPLRFLPFILPAAMFTATVVTGNHYFLEAPWAFASQAAALASRLPSTATAPAKACCRRLTPRSPPRSSRAKRSKYPSRFSRPAKPPFASWVFVEQRLELERL